MRSSRTGVAAVLVAALAACAAAQENIDALNAKTLALYQQGRYAEAVPVAEEALRLAERADGATGESGRVALNNLGVIYENVERFADAERTYARALAVAERSGKSSVAVAQCLTNLGLFHKRLGRYDQAEPHYLRAIAIYEERLGRDHPDTARAANNLGELYRALGQVDQAEAFLRRGLEARLEAYGERHPEVAQSVNNLGLLAYETGALDVAGELLAAALEIRVETLGDDHPLTGQSLSNLLLVRLASRDLDDAEPLAERSLAVRTRAFGKDHVETAISLFHLASVRRLQGRLREAEGPMRESAAILSRTLGPDDPRTIVVTDGLGTLLAAAGSWDEATDTVDAARRGARRHVARVLPALAAAEQAQFLRTRDAGELQAALTLGLLRKANARSAERSAGWLANGKAVAQEASSERIILARQSGDRATTEAVATLERVRGELARLSQQAPAPDRAAAWRAAIAKLQAEERRVVHGIGGQLAALDRDEPWVGIDAIRRSIPAAAVLVDLARFEVFDFQARGKGDAWRPARYAAWIVPPAGKGDVTILDLGPAAEIDAAVTAYREAIDAARKGGFPRGQSQAEEELKVAAAPLTTKVLAPIVDALGNATEIILCPDGELWLVPWQALPLADGRYAIETYTIRMVTSARELVPGPAAADGRRSGSVIVADPAFDVTPAADDAGPAAGETRSFAPAKGLVRGFPRLVNTRAEALASQPALARLSGGEPRLLLGPDASETKLKQAAVRPRMVVLATHGFFLPDQRVKPTADGLAALTPGAGGRGTGRAVSTAGEPLEDPLLRCGLALAGANVGARGGDDGILTGAEIVGLDLLGTELVVLSACETGVGDVENSAGVAGLRQAFQIAGARSVVATLWKVPDAESARIMADFYANLGRGLPTARALREAQLAFVKDRREDRNYEAAHPYLWAAYGVTGN